MSDWSPEFAPKRTSPRPSEFMGSRPKTAPAEAALVRSPPILHAHFLPDGQISKNLSSPFEKNIPLPSSGKSALPARPVLSRQEGRSRVVTNVGGDAVDALASARVCSQGGLP